jgi:hypothetical protein
MCEVGQGKPCPIKYAISLEFSIVCSCHCFSMGTYLWLGTIMIEGMSFFSLFLFYFPLNLTLYILTFSLSVAANYLFGLQFTAKFSSQMSFFSTLCVASLAIFTEISLYLKGLL